MKHQINLSIIFGTIASVIFSTISLGLIPVYAIQSEKTMDKPINTNLPVSRTIVVSNQSLSVEEGSVSLAGKTIKTEGDVVVTEACTRDYVVVFNDDGSASCGYHDNCAAMSYSVDC